MGFREDFIEIYKNFIKRQGTEELLNWLLTTDFFVAPASTKYHCACEGGLVQHSVSVYKTLRAVGLRRKFCYMRIVARFMQS